MDALSTQVRLQSIRSASRSHRSSSRCRRSRTPTRCQSRNRRQQVTPEAHPVPSGSISHGMPVHSTDRMPIRAAPSGTSGLPPFGFATATGSSGSMSCQSSSKTGGDGIPRHESTLIKVQVVQFELLQSVTDPEFARICHDFYANVAIPADSFARGCIRIGQPEDVDINEILFPPTAQEF